LINFEGNSSSNGTRKQRPTLTIEGQKIRELNVTLWQVHGQTVAENYAFFEKNIKTTKEIT
jgi:hypothetical protein